MREIFRKFYKGSKSLIVPELKHCQFTFKDILTELVNDETEWLDLGCGHQLIPAWLKGEDNSGELSSRAKGLVGIDFDYDSLVKNKTISNKVRGDIKKLPFKDGSFNLVTSNMVVEHLEYPEPQFEEIARVLKPDGLFVFLTPRYTLRMSVAHRILNDSIKRVLIRLLEGRDDDDIFPTYYRVNSPEDIKRLCLSARLEVEKINMIESISVFYLVPPLALIDLVASRIKLMAPFAPLRSHIIAVLKKPQ